MTGHQPKGPTGPAPKDFSPNPSGSGVVAPDPYGRLLPQGQRQSVEELKEQHRRLTAEDQCQPMEDQPVCECGATQGEKCRETLRIDCPALTARDKLAEAVADLNLAVEVAKDGALLCVDHGEPITFQCEECRDGRIEALSEQIEGLKERDRGMKLALECETERYRELERKFKRVSEELEQSVAIGEEMRKDWRDVLERHNESRLSAERWKARAEDKEALIASMQADMERFKNTPPPPVVYVGVPRDRSWCGGVFSTMEAFEEYNALTGGERVAWKEEVNFPGWVAAANARDDEAENEEPTAVLGPDVDLASLKKTVADAIRSAVYEAINQEVDVTINLDDETLKADCFVTGGDPVRSASEYSDLNVGPDPLATAREELDFIICDLDADKAWGLDPYGERDNYISALENFMAAMLEWAQGVEEGRTVEPGPEDEDPRALVAELDAKEDYPRWTREHLDGSKMGALWHGLRLTVRSESGAWDWTMHDGDRLIGSGFRWPTRGDAQASASRAAREVIHNRNAVDTADNS